MRVTRGLRGLVYVLGLLVLAGCGSVPIAFPKDADTDSQTLVQDGLPRGVELKPLDGVAPPMAKLLTVATLKYLQRYDIPAGPAPFTAGQYQLSGQVMSVPKDDGRGLVVLKWALAHTSSGAITEIEQVINTTGFEWEYGSPTVIEEVSEGAARRVAAEVAGKELAVLTDHTPRHGVYVEPVAGAPGDGDVSLTRAIAAALTRRGSQLARQPERARYLLKGEVDLSPPEQNQQLIRIVWAVTHPDGSEIGRATQRNAIAAGSLDAKWGPVAGFVANAAVGGIDDVIDRWEAGDTQIAARSGGLILPADGQALPEPVAAEEGQLLGRLSDRVLPPGPVSQNDAPSSQTEDVTASPGSQPPEPQNATDQSDEGLSLSQRDQWLSRYDLQPQARASSAFMVTHVSGAPGNGAEVLRAAMRRGLRARDLSVTEDPRQAGYKIAADVSFLPVSDEVEVVRIVWQVADRDGQVFGRAAQERQIPKGSLAEDWTAVGNPIAAGALAGVQRILGDRARVFPGETAIDRVPVSNDDLPVEPGRAPPPPLR